MADNEENNEKELEVVTGDGSELEFSPVYEHLNALKPKAKEENKKKIIIPEVKSKKQTINPEDNKVTIQIDDDIEETDVEVIEENNEDEKK